VTAAYLAVVFTQAAFVGHVASAKAILRGRGRANAIEALLLIVHLAGYATALLLVLSPPRAAAFVLVQQGLFGLYLGCTFVPNHKGMCGSRLVDFVLGGLNYQIERLHSVGARHCARHRPPPTKRRHGNHG
jgi:hypothetical protein